MSLLGIAWRSIRQRLFTSGLTALSLALGVALVVATLVIGGVVRDAFASGQGLGYNLIVGAKGSPLQLVLNSVYLVSKPIENISWSFYQEFLPASARPDGVAGRYAGSIAKAVPICMGDYYRSFRVVGTNAAYFDSLTVGDGRPFAFAAGRNFRDAEFFGGVLGSAVAAKLGLAVGDAFSPTHGADDGLVHDPFTVTGILARTDTPVDRGVYVNMEGFYLQEGHAKPLPAGEIAEQADAETDSPARAGNPAPLPFAQREVTAILVETASPGGMPAELLAMGLKTTINEGRDGQAAEPVREIRQLLDLFVRPLELLLLLVTALVVVVSAISILVSMV
ncbi:MAG: ABC transporter permease, partial [Planctomycetota bacterium]